MLEKVKKYGLWLFNSFIWLGVLLFVIDIVTKSVVVANMNVNDSIPLIPGFLHITYTVNTEAAFGVGVGSELANRIVYIVLASLASIAIIFVYVNKYKTLNRFYKATMMMILVGALGNLVDRIFYTPEYLKYNAVGVVDWIDFCGIWKYIFNWADSCIVVGVLMLIVYLIVQEILDAKKAKNQVVLSKDQVDAKIEAQKVEEGSKEEPKQKEEK